MSDETQNPEPQEPESTPAESVEPTPFVEPESTPAPEPEPAPAPTPDPEEAVSAPPPTTEPAVVMPVAVPGGITQEEKTFAMVAWFGGIVAGFIPALVIYLMATDKPFAKRHAGMALGLQVVAVIAAFVAFILSFVFIGIFLFPVIGIGMLVFSIMGGMAASNGQAYDVPVVGPMIAKTLNL